MFCVFSVFRAALPRTTANPLTPQHEGETVRPSRREGIVRVQLQAAAQGEGSCPTLGTLKRLPVREVFKDEARDFTPWLALPDNLAKIGNIIGLDLELVGTEYAVGPFAADILCKASPGDGYVIIENQTTVSDHTHLGQIMTYSAGLNALATVWIASSFKAEHREAVEWLNRVTNQEANFFALEVACLKIDESLPAADFNVVAGPSSWPPTEVDTMTSRAKLWLEFWTAFNEYLEACCPQIKSRKAVRDSWCSFRSGIPNLSLVVEFPKGGYLYAELYSFGGHKDLFSKLEEEKARIAGVMGEDVGFFNRKDRQYSSVWVRREADPSDRERWPELFDWLKPRLLKLRALEPLVHEAKAALPGSSS